MSSCDFAYALKNENEIKNIDNVMNYEYQRYIAFKKYKLAQFNRTKKILDETTNIYNKYDEGFYVKQNYTIPQSILNNAGIDSNFYSTYYVESNGTLSNCRAAGTNAFCTDTNLLESKCCGCGKFHLCNKINGCGITGSCDNKLNINLFQSAINNEVSGVAKEVDREIETFKFAYENIPLPQINNIQDIGCCQSLMFEGISANNIIIDINQKCTIINDKI